MRLGKLLSVGEAEDEAAVEVAAPAETAEQTVRSEAGEPATAGR
jgi:hypothetical protein